MARDISGVGDTNAGLPWRSLAFWELAGDTITSPLTFHVIAWLFMQKVCFHTTCSKWLSALSGPCCFMFLLMSSENATVCDSERQLGLEWSEDHQTEAQVLWYHSPREWHPKQPGPTCDTAATGYISCNDNSQQGFRRYFQPPSKSSLKLLQCQIPLQKVSCLS